MTIKELNNRLHMMQEAVNNEPCGFCGANHSTTLTADGSDLRPVVRFGFSEDACVDYQRAVKSYVSEYLHGYGYPTMIL